MKVTITVTASETREVEFADYDLEEGESTEQDLLDCVEEDINDSLCDFVADNCTDVDVVKAEEEPKAP